MTTDTGMVEQDPMNALTEALERIAFLERQVKQLQDKEDHRLRVLVGSENVGHAWLRTRSPKSTD